MLAEKPPPADLDADSPPLRAALARLCANLASQLQAVAADLDGARATPWQCVELAARLDRVREQVDYTRKSVARFGPIVGDDV